MKLLVEPETLVQAGAAVEYIGVAFLPRRIGDLGDDEVNTEVVEGFYSADLSYLQEFYRRINEDASALVKTACPHCEQEFDFDLGSLGGA